MPLNPSTNRPTTYNEARRRFSQQFLSVFDKKVASYYDVDWRPSESVMGFLYLMMSCVTMGIPVIVLALLKYSHQVMRDSLTNALVSISNDSVRLLIANSQNCCSALEASTLLVEDVSKCPVPYLRELAAPHVVTFLKFEANQVGEKAMELSRQRGDLISQKLNSRSDYDRGILESRIKAIDSQIDRNQQFMEQFREKGYPSYMFNELMNLVAQPAQHSSYQPRR